MVMEQRMENGEWRMVRAQAPAPARLAISDFLFLIPTSEQYHIELLLQVLLIRLEADRLAKELFQFRNRG